MASEVRTIGVPGKSPAKWPVSARLLRSLSRSPDSGDYAGGTQTHVGEHALDFILRTVPGFLDMVCRKTVLDYGCGIGHQVLAIKAAGAKFVAGYDPFPKFLEERPERAACLTDLPSGKFDVVINSSSLRSARHKRARERIQAADERR